MPKVLIIGPSFFDINKSIKSAFELLGWDVTIEEYDDPIHPFKGWTKWEHKFSSNKALLKEKSREKFRPYIESRFLEIEPDLVFIFNGAVLQTASLDFFRTKSKVIVWMMDSIARFPQCSNHIDHVDAFFSFDQIDVNNYLNAGKKAHFLPLACDPKIYYPTGDKKDIDIVFIGNLYNQQKRIGHIKEIINNFPNLKIAILGVYKPFYKNVLKCLFRERKDIFNNANVSQQEANKYYNRSKIAINIHFEKVVNATNLRLFEICGTGTYQICDANPYIESVFKNGEIGIYHNTNDLIALIKDAIENDKSKNANQAKEIILNEHTFKHRVETVLQTLNLL